MNAKNRRIAAMSQLTSTTCATGTNAQGQIATVILGDRATVAAAIRELAPLGRTERWTVSIESWACAVEDQGNPFLWAFQQYAVYAASAID